jgi:hypothetical protein
MGRIDYDDRLQAAARFDFAKARQKELRDNTVYSDAVMLDRRRDFMLASQRVLRVHHCRRQKHIAARNNQIRVYIYDHDLPPAERQSNSFPYYSTDTLRGSSGGS